MPAPRKTGQSPLWEIVWIAIFFLFFFQLLSDLVESTYAFGLLQTGIPVEVVSILLIFSPLALLFFPRQASREFLLVTGELLLFSRAASVLLDTRGKMLLSGFGVALFLVFFPVLLWQLRRKGENSLAVRLGAGLALASGLLILLRTLQSGNDISGQGVFRWLPWALALAAGAVLPKMLKAVDTPAVRTAPVARRGVLVRVLGLSLGISSVFVLLYFAFASPGVIARWSGMSYPATIFIAAFSLGLFFFLWMASPAFRADLTPALVVGWNLLFIGALALALRAYQVPFPAAAGAYPLIEPPVSPAAPALLAAALALHPILFIDFALLSRALQVEAPSIRMLGWGFSLGSFYLLLLILAQVFTSVYDYVPVLGPLMRDRFWLVYAAAGVTLILSALLVNAACYRLPARLPGMRALPALAAALALVAAPVLAATLTAARPAPPAQTNTLRVLSYNVQQGYNAAGQKDFAGQLEAIRRAGADVIGLAESDLARISGGNSDLVRYIADQLGLHAYYGPRTVSGTFGVALLSRYPIHNPETFYLYSDGEQTAAIQAQIVAGGQTFNLLVTHLGNDGPLIQQQQVLQQLSGRQNVIAMGDFNFHPGGEQYLQTVKRLDDAWQEAGERQVQPPGLAVERRIDHIFISPGLRVSHAAYLDPGASDHPMILAEIDW